MSKLSSWFRSTPAAVSADSSAGGSKGTKGSKGSKGDATRLSIQDDDVDAETRFRATKKAAELEDALAAVSLVMNDDIEGATEALAKGDSPFHMLGLALTCFMRAVMGFEKDVMAEASAKLAECEARAWAELKAAQKKDERHSDIYAPGTEYTLLAAETQLMSAVVSVLHESLTEALKGFYKLRKAYLTLDAIAQAERKAFSPTSGSTSAPGSVPAPLFNPVEDDPMPGSFDESEFADMFPKTVSGNKNGDAVDVLDEKRAAAEIPEAQPVPTQSQLPLTDAPPPSSPSTLEKDLSQLRLQEGEKSRPLAGTNVNANAATPALTNPLDIFIHSGANMCYGLLHILISMVPPAMSRLLSIIGFQGDRSRGVSMLWSATRFHNINGAASGLVLLAYYNGLLGTADILPPISPPSLSSSSILDQILSARCDGDTSHDTETDVVGIPREKCAALLAEMRRRYPESRIWRIEEARGLAQECRLRDAIETLTTGPAAKMRQVAALNAFELALDAMFAQDWPLMRDSALRCLELNDWSHSLYYYLAGCAELERYRDAVHEAEADEDETRRRKTRVEELWRKAPTVAGRKKFMAKPMPFDMFVQRKIDKFEARAKELGVSLADAAGPSPALEMAALWCGPKRMDAEELRRMRVGLAWERCTAGEEGVRRMKENPDEKAVRAANLAGVLRLEGKLEEARSLLKDEVLCYDRSLLKGALRDDYSWPLAHYELGVIAWAEACAVQVDGATGADSQSEKSNGETSEAKLRACCLAKAREAQEHLDVVVRGEAFLFDARIGMRVQTGLETLRWFQARMEAS
ncbi:hypothetical protein SODALDRAFT_325290 [Sodiomyces alkalinus F11]|uniref:Inclusion body clearance protein IML2 n=1 Tax=Sodiomyces alkalinus (strain CBS 110278 / VKM F-3762 / F11) TaxID=1314773 RepID=A0A3N2PQC0_SODAK|nr:hypothetical protein SODALDRAFT_325290 [Sodiomyces alkalinus F11]ROT36678.1 hypothetical protein SODALDRAFT_325290 [Sodiomyces alkalinus F11]